MSIQVIPAGASVVVDADQKDKHPDRWDLAAQAERNHQAETVQGTLTEQQLSSGFADSLVDSTKNAAASQLEAEKNTNELSGQATANFNLSSVQAVMFAGQADVSRQKFAYEQQILSNKLASDAAAKAAECCCELKTAVHAEGEKTRDLITQVQMQDLRDSRTKLEIAYASLFAGKVAPVAPVI